MSKPIVQCRYGYRQTKRGLVYNRAHRCERSCQWTGEQAIEWANGTPYPGATQPPVQVEHVPCSCGRSYADHLQTRKNAGGFVTGISERPCDTFGGSWPKRHLLSCDCLECVTSRITSDRRALVEVAS